MCVCVCVCVEGVCVCVEGVCVSEGVKQEFVCLTFPSNCVSRFYPLF